MDLYSLLVGYNSTDRKALLILILIYSHTIERLSLDSDSAELQERMNDFHNGLVDSSLAVPNCVIVSINSDPYKWFCQALVEIESVD